MFLFVLSIIVKIFSASHKSANFSESLAQILTMMFICITIGLIGATVAFIAALSFNRYLYSKLAKPLD